MNKIIKKQIKSDIVVVGAGFAGVCAAITAARRGAHVTLIEKESDPGGTAMGLRHRFLCGLFCNSSERPQKYLNRGLTEEFCKRFSPSTQPVRMGKVWLLPYNPERLAIVLDDLLTREKNIKVFYSSKISACSCQQGRIESVRYSRHGKYYELKAKVFIDAGAGILLQKCGAVQFSDLSERQMSGYTLELTGVPWDDVLPIRVPYVLYQAVKRGDLPLYVRWSAVSVVNEEKDTIHLKLSLPANAPLSLANKLSTRIIKTLRQELSSFRMGRVVWRARNVFSRDGIQLQGKYILKEKDVLVGKRFFDGVIKGAWPIELWDPKQGPIYKYPQAGYYELPLRSLWAKSIGNLLAAGRCVSAEPGAQASLRVGGLCIPMGEAAGNAAVESLSILRK